MDRLMDRWKERAKEGKEGGRRKEGWTEGKRLEGGKKERMDRRMDG
jgi:hypothetical protein